MTFIFVTYESVIVKYDKLNICLSLSWSITYSSIFDRHYLQKLQIAQCLFVFIFFNYELLNICLSLSSSIMYSSIFARHYLCQLQIAQYLFVFIFVNYELLNVCLSLSSSIMNCSTFLNNKSSTTEEDNHSVSSSILHIVLSF